MTMISVIRTPESIDRAWMRQIEAIKAHGRRVAPRGAAILELDHYTLCVDMRYPVLVNPGRKINYRFMATEALWILRGDDRIAPLIEVNPHMAAFSDDGVTLAGAYGPRIVPQLDYVVDRLVEDRETRRATLTIWTPNPGPSKDYPCTVAMDFKVRDGALDLHVFMRSSDAWLGVPYDVFSFTCVAIEVLRRLTARLGAPMPESSVSSRATIGLGTLFLTAASSHLYEQHWAIAVRDATPPPPVPDGLLRDPESYLSALAASAKGDPVRWWGDAR